MYCAEFSQFSVAGGASGRAGEVPPRSPLAGRCDVSAPALYLRAYSYWQIAAVSGTMGNA